MERKAAMSRLTTREYDALGTLSGGLVETTPALHPAGEKTSDTAGTLSTHNPTLRAAFVLPRTGRSFMPR